MQQGGNQAPMFAYAMFDAAKDLGGGALCLDSARYYLDFVCLDNLAAVFHLEGHVLQLEGPHLIAETVGIQASLARREKKTTLAHALP